MTENPWDKDVLNRKPYADFLTAYLVSKFKASTSKPKALFTLALDAQWGLGKSFFITNWSKDLANSERHHPTFVFDAWQADHTADPLIAFMAAFKAALDKRVDAAGLNKGAKKKIADHISGAMSGFRRAILPAGKQIAKGLLRKTTGIAAEEVYNAWVSESGTAAPPSTETMSEVGLDTLNKGLDVFFDQLLADQKALEQAIDDFKAGMSVHLKHLPRQRRPPRGFGESSRSLKLRDVAWEYYSLKDLDLKMARETYDELNVYDYPNCLVDTLLNELPGHYVPGKAYPPSIAGYFELVKR